MADRTERKGLVAKLRRRVPASLACELRTLAALFSRMPQAVYVGWVGHGNLGDDILFQAHEQLFRGVTLSVYGKSRVFKLLCSIGRSPYRFGILGVGR